MCLRNSLLAGLLAASALAAPAQDPSSFPRDVPQVHSLSSRSVIDHDAVVPFSETVPDTDVGALYLKYKPHLKVFNGCVPFPAVDADGNTSGGLKPTGGSSIGCSSSTGQIYARSTTYGAYLAIMYSWYMPKDSPSTGLGHRHDWENIILFLSSSDYTLYGMTVSAHGRYSASTSPSLDGTSPLVGYISDWPVNHQLIFTDTNGGTQPLVAWESLTDAARTALEDTDFGSANVPCKDANFEGNVEEAAGVLGV